MRLLFRSSKTRIIVQSSLWLLLVFSQAAGAASFKINGKPPQDEPVAVPVSVFMANYKSHRDG